MGELISRRLGKKDLELAEDFSDASADVPENYFGGQRGRTEDRQIEGGRDIHLVPHLHVRLSGRFGRHVNVIDICLRKELLDLNRVGSKDLAIEFSDGPKNYLEGVLGYQLQLSVFVSITEESEQGERVSVVALPTDPVVRLTCLDEIDSGRLDSGQLTCDSVGPPILGGSSPAGSGDDRELDILVGSEVSVPCPSAQGSRRCSRGHIGSYGWRHRSGGSSP